MPARRRVPRGAERRPDLDRPLAATDRRATRTRRHPAHRPGRRPTSARLDPHYASGTQDRALVDMVFNGLLRFKPGDATAFEPDLATALPAPITDADGKQVWTFFLRKGVMCHPSDGVPAYELTSDDVVYSLQKAANKDTSAYASDYAGMTFASAGPVHRHRHARQAAVDRAVLPARRELLGRLHHVQARPRRSSARTA